MCHKLRGVAMTQQKQLKHVYLVGDGDVYLGQKVRKLSNENGCCVMFCDDSELGREMAQQQSEAGWVLEDVIWSGWALDGEIRLTIVGKGRWIIGGWVAGRLAEADYLRPVFRVPDGAPVTGISRQEG
jgi:hypothetical protein